MRKVTWKDLMDAALDHSAYDTWSGRADAILKLIYGSDDRKLSAAQREERMEYCITRFSVVIPRNQAVTPPLGVSMIDEQYDPISQRVAPLVYEFSRKLTAENHPSCIVACMILGFLDGFDHESRVVVFSVLIREPLIPYTQMPAGMFTMGRPGRRRKKGIDPYFLESMVLMRRLIRDPRLDNIRRLAGIDHVLRRHQSADDRRCLMHTLIQMVGFELQHRMVQDGEQKLRAVEALFDGMLKRTGTSFDSHCPVHGDGSQKKKKEDKPS